MDRVPEHGQFLGTEDAEELYEAIQQHQRNFPDTPEIVSFTLVLLNYGKRFTPVQCIEQEWEGIISDVPRGDGKEDPKCPNGHAINKGEPLKLAWLYANTTKEENGSRS